MEGLERILAHGHACRRRLLATGGRIHSACLAKTERRHVYIDVLVGSWIGNVGLMPYADRTIGTNGLIERPPGRQMLSLLVACVSKELLQAAPVLNHDGRAAEPGLSMQK